MKFNDKDQLRLDQIEQTLQPFRGLLTTSVPRRGWVHAIQRALGITNVQLAKRLGIKPQTLEDMQGYEAAGTIKLQTLRKIADGLGCKLVYALVPIQPLDQIRHEQAREVASRQLRRASHSMKLEDQGVSVTKENRELNRLTDKLLAGDPKKLWE